MNSGLPAGTVTFLFTDIEGSTRLLRQLGGSYRQVLEGQRRLVRQAIARWNGREVDAQGDAFFVSFPRAGDALEAAVEIQRALAGHAWPAEVEVWVRMGLHTGEPQVGEEGYVGIDVHRAARLAHAGHGGQVLLSETTAALVRGELPEGISLQDLGEHRLKDLPRPERIFQLVIPGKESDFPPLAAERLAGHNLPRHLSSFIGRARETEQLKGLLGDKRLVTLVGAGGVGKTRLSIQVASELVAAYPDGIWMIELATLADPALVPQTVAHACGVREAAGLPVRQALLDFLCSRRLLLVLDNCEHLIEACARFASEVLRTCPHVRLLASSREPLGVAGEVPYHVPSLAVVDPGPVPPIDDLMQVEAVRLFQERAATVRPGFEITPQNAAAVVQICRRLDGIPLAIELAAARVKVLSVDQIAGRLDDRFRLLTGGLRTALPRQQTLRATIDWSHQLLNQDERLLFRRLAVFVGGWTLEAVEAICASLEDGPEEELDQAGVLDVLASLVDKSMVLKEESAGTARYHRLETVRQYALEKLLDSGEVGLLRDRHLHWYLALVEEVENWLEGPQQRQGLMQLQAEHGNLRAGLEWSLNDRARVEAGLRLACALVGFWAIRGYLSEGRERLVALLEFDAMQSPPNIRAKAHSAIARLAYLQSDYPATRDHFERSLALYRDLGPEGRNGVAVALIGLGNVATEVGDYDRAPGLFEEGLQIMRQIQNRPGVADALRNLGWCALRPGDYALAKDYLEEALVEYRQIKEQSGTASTLSGLGEVAIRTGEYTEAERLLKESLDLRRQLGHRWGTAASLGSLGWVALRQGDLARTRSLLGESLEIRQEIGDLGGIAWCLEKLAEAAGEAGDHERQVQVYSAAAALRESIDSVIDPADQPEYQRILAAARAELGGEQFESAWTRGRALSLEEAISVAIVAG